MTMGIEQFRNLTTDNTQLANRRVRVDGPEGMETLRAPQSRWGRFVDWVKGIGHGGVNQAKVEANNQARQAFYNALVKATNEDFAKEVIKANTGENLDTFLNKGTGLKLSRIKDMLEISDDAQLKFQQANLGKVDTYVAQHLGRVVNALSQSEHSTLGFPDLKPNDPDVQRAFRELVTSHKDYGHRVFDDNELDLFANQAVDLGVKAKIARFDEQYSYLAKLDVPYAHDLETFFNSVDKDLDDRTTSFGQIQNSAKGWIRGVMDGLRTTGERLSKMEFDPKDVHNEIRRTKQARDDLAGRLNVEPMGLWRLELRAAENDIGAMLQDEPVLWGNVKDREDDHNKVINMLVSTELENAMRDVLSQDDSLSLLDSPENEGSPMQQVLDRVCDRLDRHLLDENIVINEQDRKDIVSDFRKNLQETLTNSQGIKDVGKTREQTLALRDTLIQEGKRQLDRLDSKIRYMTEYIKSDPLSNKAVLYDKMVWAKSKLVVLQQVRDKVEQQPQDTVEQKRKVDRELRRIDDKIGESQKEYESLVVQWGGQPLTPEGLR